MNKNSLADAYAAALQPVTASAPDLTAHGLDRDPLRQETRAARAAVLMAAVCRSLESCRDPAQQRLLQTLRSPGRH